MILVKALYQLTYNLNLLIICSSVLALAANPLVASSQNIDLDTVFKLPRQLNEASGMELSNNGFLWLHNDSGNDPFLYEVDTANNGAVLDSVFVKSDVLKDWEDVCRDDDGSFYIGDFGNNSHNRTDLQILKITDPENQDTLESEIIHFNFEDQSQFPPPLLDRNFDCEAFVYFEDSLYLFSKNWGLSTVTRMYVLPSDSGTYEARVLDTYDTGGFITAADISPNGKTLALLSMNYIWIFYDYNGRDFFSGNAKKFKFVLTQKEALVFVDDSLLYIADEKSDSDGYVYSIHVPSLLDTVTIDTSATTRTNLQKKPIVFYDGRNLNVRSQTSIDRLEIYDALGRLLITHEPKQKASQVHLELRDKGIYFIKIQSEGQFQSTSVIVP